MVELQNVTVLAVVLTLGRERLPWLMIPPKERSALITGVKGLPPWTDTMFPIHQPLVNLVRKLFDLMVGKWYRMLMFTTWVMS